MSLSSPTGHDLSVVLIVLFGNGHGTFLPSFVRASGGALFGITAADVNGDGIADVVGQQASPTSYAGLDLSQFVTVLGSRDRQMPLIRSGPTLDRRDDLKLIDIDHDGFLDLWSDGNPVLYGKGDGSFVVDFSRCGLPAGLYPLAIRDLDGDQVGDLIALAGDRQDAFLPEWSTHVAVALGRSNRGDCYELPSRRAVGTSEYANWAVADLLQDGAPEIYALDTQEFSPFTQHSGVPLPIASRGRGPLIPSGVAYTTAIRRDPAQVVATGDFNGDGLLDFLTGSGGCPTCLRGVPTAFYWGQPDGTLLMGEWWPALAGVSSAWAGDFNEDGRADLVTVVLDADTGEQVVTLLVNQMYQ